MKVQESYMVDSIEVTVERCEGDVSGRQFEILDEKRVIPADRESGDR